MIVSSPYTARYIRRCQIECWSIYFFNSRCFGLCPPKQTEVSLPHTMPEYRTLSVCVKKYQPELRYNFTIDSNATLHSPNNPSVYILVWSYYVDHLGCNETLPLERVKHMRTSNYQSHTYNDPIIELYNDPIIELYTVLNIELYTVLNIINRIKKVCRWLFNITL